MSEFRINPLTGEMTLYAENRKNRPYEFHHAIQTKQPDSTNCSFCGGHEAWTTEAVYQDQPDDAWQIRVFPNLYPAVSEDSREFSEREDFYEQATGRGRHEILVDTREHSRTIDTFTAEHLARVLAVLQVRSRDIASDATIAYVQIFKNCGPSAGMSIRHSHWQIMGIPVVPRRVRSMVGKMQTEDCLLCKILSYEQEKGRRIAGETAHFSAFAPYASRFPYELWIAPKTHQAHFTGLSEAERQELSELLLRLLQRLAAVQEEVGYNICVMDAPRSEDFHWHIEILPRIGGFAGFEYATDCFINLVLPEKAAAYYRGEQAEE